MHNHAAAPAPAPPVNLNDNVITGNRISGNAADTADAATPGPTGINVYSVAPITGTVISQNVFEDEAVNIAFKAPAGQVNAHLNDFTRYGIGVDNLGTGYRGCDSELVGLHIWPREQEVRDRCRTQRDVYAVADFPV